MLPYYKNNRAGYVIEQAILDTQKSRSHTNRGYQTQGFLETLLSFSYCQCISVLDVTITLVSECKMYFIQTSLCTVL